MQSSPGSPSQRLPLRLDKGLRRPSSCRCCKCLSTLFGIGAGHDARNSSATEDRMDCCVEAPPLLCIADVFTTLCVAVGASAPPICGGRANNPGGKDPMLCVGLCFLGADGQRPIHDTELYNGHVACVTMRTSHNRLRRNANTTCPNPFNRCSCSLLSRCI